MKKINFSIPKTISLVDFLSLIIVVVLALMTFVSRDIKSYYGSDFARGLGIICLMVAWLFNLSSKNIDFTKKFIIKRAVAIAFLITSMILLASLASFVTMSIYIAFLGLVMLLKYLKFI